MRSRSLLRFQDRVLNLTGKYRGSAHQSCIDKLNLKLPNFIPIIIYLDMMHT
jgi:hypothetical protein